MMVLDAKDVIRLRQMAQDAARVAQARAERFAESADKKAAFDEAQDFRRLEKIFSAELDAV